MFLRFVADSELSVLELRYELEYRGSIPDKDNVFCPPGCSERFEWPPVTCSVDTGGGVWW